jgi:hypothetical protein
MRKVLVLLGAVLFLMVGCQTLTPEQQVKANAAQAAMTDATAQLAKIRGMVDGWIAEYNAIKARIDAGESIPAALVARYAELSKLISQGAADVQSAIAKVQTAKKAYDDAIAAGVAWYNNIPWSGIAGALLGIVGIYFPVVRPATMAAQAVIQGVAAVAAKDSAAGQLAKDAVLSSSRALGVETVVDNLVQKYDPPK